jgi:predicted phosphodiesterase
LRIAILSDVHANLLFLEKALAKIRDLGVDRAIHLGDAIDLGPWPSETLDALVAADVDMVRGNHDEYPILGIPLTMSDRLSGPMRAHMSWTEAQLRTDQLAILAALPPMISFVAEDWRIRCQHFLLDEDRVSSRMIEHTTVGFRTAFELGTGEILCFGHLHARRWDYDGVSALLNPGASGFGGPDGGYLAVLVAHAGAAWIEWHPVEFDARVVASELVLRGVPDAEGAARYMLEATLP